MNNIFRRIKLAWLGLTKPHLVYPALMINKAIVGGTEQKYETIISRTDGSGETFEIRINVRRL